MVTELPHNLKVDVLYTHAHTEFFADANESCPYDHFRAHRRYQTYVLFSNGHPI